MPAPNSLEPAEIGIGPERLGIIEGGPIALMFAVAPPICGESIFLWAPRYGEPGIDIGGGEPCAPIFG